MENMANLKGFPFESTLKCYEMSYIYWTDWEKFLVDLSKGLISE